MDIKEIMLKYVAKQHGISEAAAAELLYQKSEDEEGTLTLKEDALTVILAKDQERVNKLKSAEVDKTKIYDEAYAKAKTEILPKAEKKLAEKYGIEGTEFKLEKLVQDIVAKETEGLKGDKLDEDAVKKHPAYLSLERARTEELKNLQTTHAAELETIRADYAKTEVKRTVKGSVLPIFRKLRPVLSKDPERALNQERRFVNDFTEAYNFQQEGEQTLVLDPETGKRLEDAHGNPITLESLVEKEANSLYDFAKQDPKGSPGNSGGGVNNGYKFTVPETEEDYAAAIIEAPTVEARAEITAAYEANK